MLLSRLRYAGQSTLGHVGDVHLEAGSPVDVLPQDVGVAGVPGEVGEDVDEHPVERDVAVARPTTTAPAPAASSGSSATVASLKAHTRPVEVDDLPPPRPEAGTHQSACGSAS